MKTIALGSSDLEVSRIGFGCCPMGGYGWGQIAESELRYAVDTALGCGINLFDTADIYGKGISEQRLGAFLGAKRRQAVIATKVGLRFKASNQSYRDNSPAWITAAVDLSLSRLGTDYIDLYQLHYWDGTTGWDDIFDCFQRIRAAGKIRWFGVTNVDVAAIQYKPAELVSFSCEYSLVARCSEPLIEQTLACEDLTFLSWGSIGQGLLSGKYNLCTSFSANDRRSRAEYHNFHGERLNQALLVVRRVDQAAGARGCSAAQLSLAWTLARFPRSVALVGIKTPDQARHNAAAADLGLSDEAQLVLGGVPFDGASPAVDSNTASDLESKSPE